MTIYRFDDFRFDAARHELRKNGVLIKLRPKTLLLLRLLLQQRHAPMGRDAILSQVWPTTRAGSNNLFQAISELRSAFKPLDPIRTIPNLGYQWSLPLRQQRSWWPAAAIAASLLLLVAASITLPTQSVTTASSLPPAYRALFAGKTLLDKGEPIAAATQFELALAENPDFSEAQLLLAESLLQADQLERARLVLDGVLAAQPGQHDAYAEMAAMEMMGQLHQRAGASEASLDWMTRAFINAEQAGYLCAAADLESRLLDFERPLANAGEPADDDAAMSDRLAQRKAVPQLCADIPAKLKSSAVDHCDWPVEALAVVNASSTGRFKLS